MTTKALSKKKQAELERDQAIAKLREYLKPGAKVWTKVTHVARSGMSRSIEAYIPLDGEIFNITWLVVDALGYTFDSKNGGVKMGGCGMDMGHSLVYNLSRVVFSEGFQCTGASDHPNRCPSNDHTNGMREYNTDIRHSDPGYALKQTWI